MQVNSNNEGWIMPTIFDLLYREYCRARLAEMRKQLLISPEGHEVPEAGICDEKDAVGASPASHVSGGGTAPIAPMLDDPRTRRLVGAMVGRSKEGGARRQSGPPVRWR